MSLDSALSSCANDAVRQLNTLWDAIGVESEERAVFLARVAAEVEAVYKSRVSSESLRQQGLLGEIKSLQTTISDMMVSLEESVEVVRAAARSAMLLTQRACPLSLSLPPPLAPTPPSPTYFLLTPTQQNFNQSSFLSLLCRVVQPTAAGRPLIPFRDALEATRARLQETWDQRSSLLRSREAQLFQLYSDIGSGIEPTFAVLGDRISVQRIGAYDGEIRRVAAVKAARAAEIGALAGEIKELWEELGFSPGDACEISIGKGALEELGWGTPIIAILKAKVAALGAEKAAREEKITIMGQGITTLWKRLATPEEEQTAFLEAHAGIGDDVIHAVSRWPFSVLLAFM